MPRCARATSCCCRSQYLLWSLGIYGFVFWLPTIVKAGSGQGIGLTGVISAAPYVLAVVCMILNSRWSDRSGNRARFVWPWLLLGAAAFYGSYLIGPDHFWLSFPLLVIAGAAMYAPYGPYFAHISEFLPRNAAAPAIALVNSFGALGGFAGSYLVGWLTTHDRLLVGVVPADGDLPRGRARSCCCCARRGCERHTPVRFQREAPERATQRSLS